jgi:predicted transcriptional regulator
MSLSLAPMSLKLPALTRESLARLADRRNSSAHALAREAVEVFVKREEARDQFSLDAMKAWEDYQETGLHATGDEVMAWLESWGTAEELPAPVAHQ